MGLLGFSLRAAEKTAQLRKQLDTFSAESNEPPAPASCQEQDASALEALVAVAPRLSDSIPEKARPQEATAALVALRATGLQWRPEGAFYEAKASFLAGYPDTAAMRRALECEDFAAAENLAGKMAVLAEDWKGSEAHYLRAVELDDRFWKPRFNLGILYLQQKRVAEAVPLLERAVELAPEDPLIAVHLGHAYSGRAKAAEAAGKKQEALVDRDRANTVWCRASQQGSVMGELLCFRK